ncbi:MAG: chorismate synthase, partial [Bacteroidetes bacterium]|nr:chorismate synthase [Bacteroidota bacterium]
MAGSTYGTIFRITTFGESHGRGIGGIIDGVPAGLEIDIARVQDDLNKRKPGQSEFTTARKEDDKLEILSGIFEGKTLGTPIGFFIANKDSRSQD